MRVALMVTGVNDAMYPETGKAVERLLRRLGVDVEFPSAQTCCALACAQPAMSSSNGWRVSTAQGSCTRSSSGGSHEGCAF
jgi:Cysteine-rich domain